jgi:flagellar motor protein MotB
MKDAEEFQRKQQEKQQQKQQAEQQQKQQAEQQLKHKQKAEQHQKQQVEQQQQAKQQAEQQQKQAEQQQKQQAQQTRERLLSAAESTSMSLWSGEELRVWIEAQLPAGPAQTALQRMEEFAVNGGRLIQCSEEALLELCGDSALAASILRNARDAHLHRTKEGSSLAGSLDAEDKKEEYLAEIVWPWSNDCVASKPQSEKGYELQAASTNTAALVARLYEQRPVPGWSVARVEVVNNPRLVVGFQSRAQLLERRFHSDAFAPLWEHDDRPDWRAQCLALLDARATEFTCVATPHVKLIPMWHGTKAAALDSMFQTGFANLATTDSGFFGKGIYAAGEAEYSSRVYGQGGTGALILVWMSTYSSYPVIGTDMKKLQGKANYSKYDSHFVPVKPASADPGEVNYFPTEPGQAHVYTEMVVFDSAQCLPRLVVHLQPDLPQQLDPPAQPHVASWDVDAVVAWAVKIGLPQVAELLQMEDIDGQVLLTLSEQDLKDLGVASFGQRRKLRTQLSMLAS